MPSTTSRNPIPNECPSPMAAKQVASVTLGMSLCATASQLVLPLAAPVDMATLSARCEDCPSRWGLSLMPRPRYTICLQHDLKVPGAPDIRYAPTSHRDHSKSRAATFLLGHHKQREQQSRRSQGYRPDLSEQEYAKTAHTEVEAVKCLKAAQEIHHTSY